MYHGFFLTFYTSNIFYFYPHFFFSTFWWDVFFAVFLLLLTASRMGEGPASLTHPPASWTDFVVTFQSVISETQSKQINMMLRTISPVSYLATSMKTKKNGWLVFEHQTAMTDYFFRLEISGQHAFRTHCRGVSIKHNFCTVTRLRSFHSIRTQHLACRPIDVFFWFF